MRNRIHIVGALAVTIAVGLTSRYSPLGNRFWDQDIGDIVSGTASYFLMALIFPSAKIRSLTILAIIYCVTVEYFKLTGIPYRVAHIAPLRWLLGTTFSLHNIPLYLVGILASVGIDWRWLKKRG